MHVVKDPVVEFDKEMVLSQIGSCNGTDGRRTSSFLHEILKKHIHATSALGNSEDLNTNVFHFPFLSKNVFDFSFLPTSVSQLAGV